MPEAGLKCPRCESTNTKFCYFNNYSLTQPRHFCKTCRRYWTRGGALRSVPVGGGCRRNKRGKGNNRSRSPAVTAAASNSTTSGGCGGISPASTSTTASADVIIGGHNLPPPGPSQLLPFLPPLHNLGGYIPSNIGLNLETSRKFCGIDTEFQIGNTAIGGGAILPNGIADRHWGLQQFPFFSNNNLQASTQVGFYPLEGVQGTGDDYQLLPKSSDSAQISAVKMEEADQGLNPSRNFSGISGSDQYWPGSGNGTGNPWGNDLSHGFSSSTSHLLWVLSLTLFVSQKSVNSLPDWNCKSGSADRSMEGSLPVQILKLPDSFSGFADPSDFPIKSSPLGPNFLEIYFEPKKPLQSF